MKRILALLAALLLLAPAVALADSYAGVYGGYSVACDTDIKDSSDAIILKDAEFEEGVLVGGKLGYWTEKLPWLATELNVWGNWTGIKEGPDLNLVNFSLSVLLQLPIGPLRPYAGVAAVGTWAELKNDESETDLALGYMGHGGVEFKIAHSLAVFGEYRYVWTPLNFKDVGRDFDLRRNEFLGGLNLHY